ncbi:MAG TPA: hypothetical protein IGS52_00955 [Oscillatoriaceae cyanobacterium M33_DOE_052]|uniref:Uncharacterized protein n=1 Tax=Planktothricoides sp. SpSt-374 TaxID=2282167 RepID=A0A7C3ZMA5_9CYAN|nr:hypothetical protein [Oscillatoriaceae cyanobacterium M33_DOE_052]
MDTSVDKTLLAFLLALYRLDSPLTGAEVLDLQNNLGTLLELRPDQDAAILGEINKILAKHPELNALYQEAMTKLAPLEGEQLYHRLPPKNLLEQQLGITSSSKGYIPQGKPNQKNTEVVNLSRMVMTSDRPDKAAKNLNFLQEYWELATTPIF